MGIGLGVDHGIAQEALGDVVFVDLVMPKKNGVAAAREIRDLWPEAKLIACTTLEPAEAGAPAGLFDAWIAKPFTQDQIAGVLKDVVYVPVEAVFNEDGKRVCYVRGLTGADRREVETGDFNDSFIEIKKGEKDHLVRLR